LCLSDKTAQNTPPSVGRLLKIPLARLLLKNPVKKEKKDMAETLNPLGMQLITLRKITLWRREEHDMRGLEKIVVGHDLQAGGEIAARSAAELTTRCGAHVKLVHVVEP
jgi:phosphomannomutase